MPLLRALVHLERDPDGSLNLRLSREDIEKMPTVDEVLERVAGLNAQDPGDALDSLIPSFEYAPVEDAGESSPTSRARVVPPIPGYEIYLLSFAGRDEGTDDERMTIQVVDTAASRLLWQSHFYDPPDRLEFSGDSQAYFYLASDQAGGEVFSLTNGPLCSFRRAVGRADSLLVRWPLFIEDAGALLFVKNDSKVRRLNLEDCTVHEIGSIDLDLKVKPIQATIFAASFSTSGQRLLVGVEKPTGHKSLRAGSTRCGFSSLSTRSAIAA